MHEPNDTVRRMYAKYLRKHSNDPSLLTQNSFVLQVSVCKAHSSMSMHPPSSGCIVQPNWQTRQPSNWNHKNRIQSFTWATVKCVAYFSVRLPCNQHLYRKQHGTDCTRISLHLDTTRNTEWYISHILHLHSRPDRHTSHSPCAFHSLYKHRCYCNLSMASNFYLTEENSITKMYLSDRNDCVPCNAARPLAVQTLTIMIWWTTDFLSVNAQPFVQVLFSILKFCEPIVDVFFDFPVERSTMELMSIGVFAQMFLNVNQTHLALSVLFECCFFPSSITAWMFSFSSLFHCLSVKIWTKLFSEQKMYAQSL